MKTYFLLSKPEIPPDGPVRLGSIISSPRFVEQPINDSPPPEIPAALRPQDFREENWTWHHENHHGGNAGVWTSFLQLILGVSVDGSAGASANTSETYSAAKLTTQMFKPNIEYIKRAVEADDVQDYLRDRTLFQRKDMYMVTAVKIASGATISSSRERDGSFNLSAGADLTAIGAPGVSLGPKLEGWRGSSDVRSSQISTDFVFAYRLRRIRYKKRGGEGDITSREFHDGALYGRDEMQIDDEDMDEERFEVEGLEAQDASGPEFMTQEVLDVLDDGEGDRCQVAVFRRE